MIKKLLTGIILFSGVCTFAQSFSAVYPFSGVVSGTINTGSTDPTSSPSVTGLVFGSFKAVGTYTAPSASDVFCFGGWNVGATNNNDVNFTGLLDTGIYYKVLITPQPSYTVTLNSITFNMARATTGPRHWAVRSNKDSYANNLSASISTNTNLSISAGNIFFWTTDSYTIASGNQEKGCTITLAGANFISQSTPFAFRFYAWDSESTPGTFRVDTVIFGGTASLTSGLSKLTQNINSIIKVYPNPTIDGFVYLDTKDINYAKIEVVNILGNTVFSEICNQQNNEKVILNISMLQEGTYFIRLTSGAKVYNERFFISK